MSTAPNPWTPTGEEAPPPSALPPSTPLSSTPTPPAPLPLAGPPAIRKKPWLAAALSFFPGLGHVYNGLYLRGVIFFVLVFSILGILTSSGNDNAPFFGPMMAFFWLFNIIDAYRQAVLINHGYQQDLGLMDLPKRPLPGQGGIASGIVLVLVGVYALLEQYVDIDLDWLFDLWPVVAIALGAWLIWGTIRDRKGETL